MRRRHLAAALLALSFALAADADPSFEPQGPGEVLFVGNSYLYYNGGVHSHLARLAGSSPTGVFHAATISNARLVEHQLDRYLAAHPSVDLLILQGHSTAALSARGRAQFRAAVLSAAITARARGMDVALYLTPAYAEGHPLRRPGDLDKIAGLYRDVAAEIGARVLPVGQAFDMALRQRPDLLLHVPEDRSHPTLAGTYLAAAVTYAALFERSPESATYLPAEALDAETAAFLRRVAAETVFGAPLRS